jgi:hypothetical protein
MKKVYIYIYMYISQIDSIIVLHTYLFWYCKDTVVQASSSHTCLRRLDFVDSAHIAIFMDIMGSGST